MSDPPKALPLNPAKLPWPARTLAEAGWIKPIKAASARDIAILTDWDADMPITAIGMKHSTSNDTVRRLARKHGREPRA